MKKNILVIFSDDHAQWAAGCYGNQEIKTPNLDYLASTGVQMMNAFTPTPVCSPSRANFFTGKIASQHGVHDYLASNFANPNSTQWLEDQTILPELLKDGGYQTALCGKWHLGNDTSPHPGFDYWFSLSGDYPMEHHGAYRFNNQGQDENLSGYKTQIITDRSIDFLRTRNQARPFFLFVGLTAAHSPWAGQPERLASQYRTATFDDIPFEESYPFGTQNLESTNDTRNDPREALAQYYAAVSHQDETIGRLIDELEALGLRNDTLIVYTSDHGLNTGHHGIWGKGNGTLPLNMLDESIRIPLIFNQPGYIPAQTPRTEYVDHCDLFQTLLAHAEIKQEKEANNLPGENYLPGLKNAEDFPAWREVQLGEYGDVRMIRTHRYKLIRRHQTDEIELFDLLHDKREEINLSANENHQNIVQELKVQLDDYFEKYQDPVNSGLNVLNLPQHNTTEAWRSK